MKLPMTWPVLILDVRAVKGIAISQIALARAPVFPVFMSAVRWQAPHLGLVFAYGILQNRGRTRAEKESLKGQ